MNFFLEILFCKVTGWFIFVFIGSISNLIWLYLSNKKELYSIFDYSLRLLVFKKNSMLAIAKSLLRFYLNITIFFPVQINSAWEPKYLSRVGNRLYVIIIQFEKSNINFCWINVSTILGDACVFFSRV